MRRVRTSRKTVANVVSVAVFVGLLIGFGVYVSRNWDSFSAIKNVSLQHFAAIGLATLVYFWAQGLIIRAIVQPFGIQLSGSESFGIVMTTLLGNIIFPFGGLGVRAAYLKHRHRLAYSDFASTFGAIYLVEFLVFTIGGILSLAVIWNTRGTFYVIPMVLFITVLVVCLGVFFAPSEHIRLRHRSLRSVMSVVASWQRLRKVPSLWRRLTAFTMLEFLAVSATFYVACSAIGKSVQFVETFAPACLSDYALIVRLLPASFGVYEFSTVYASQLIGCSIAEGVLVVSLVRTCNIGLVLSIGPFFTRSLMIRYHKRDTESEPSPIESEDRLQESLAA